MLMRGSWNTKRTLNTLLCLFLFLLPWQTRWIYAPAYLNGGFWEYGTRSFYATEILLGMIIILFAIDLLAATVGPHPLSLSRHRYEAGPRRGGGGEREADSSPPSGRAFLVAFWLSGVVQGLLGVWQFFFQEVVANKWLGLAYHASSQLGDFVIETAGGRWLRAYGAFGSPNILGGYLAVVFIIGLLIYLESSPRQKVLVTLGQMFILLGLIFSFSRGAWIACGAGVIILLFVIASDRRERRNPLGSAGTKMGDYYVARSSLLVMTLKQIFFSLLIVGTLFIILKPLFLTRLESTGRLEQNSINERVDQYQQFFRIFSAHPMLGVGPGAYTLALYQQNPRLPAWQYQPIHNVYLLILAEIGVVGFVIVILLNCYIVKLSSKYNPIFLSVFVALLVIGLFDHWLWSLYIGPMTWGVVVGLAICGLKQAKT